MIKSEGVAVIGSMTTDITAVADILPKKGETVLGYELTLVSGGKGSNQAVMSARAGANTWMIGCIGNDNFKHIVLDSLKKNNVNVDFVSVLEGEKTGIAHIRVDKDGNNDIVIVPLANNKTDKGKVDDFFQKNLLVNTLLLQLEIPLETAIYAAKRGKERGLTVIFDPAPAIPLPKEIYQYIDIITPNETEATILTNVQVMDLESAKKAAQVFLDNGVQTAIITLGEKGTLVMNKDGFNYYSGYNVNAIDTTAAGDAFTGTLGACLSKGMTIDKAVNYALAAGALTVTKLGAQSSLPTLEEIENLISGVDEK